MKIKSLILALAALFTCTMLFADGVSVDRARATARAYLYGNSIAPSSNLELVWTGETSGSRTTASTDKQPAFYVFNATGGGFVIVAGDDAVTPILGYSDKGSFVVDNMPAHVSWWFSHLRDYIQEGVSRGYEATEATKKAWNNIGKNAASTVVLIETPLWGQSYPYNIKAPEQYGSNCLTGCVATAMAEILRALQWPDAGVGTVEAYSTRGGINVPAHDLGHAYDYTLMPMSYGDGTVWTTDMKNQVAQLMYDCGTMVEMNYTTTGSGAYSRDVPIALIKHMKISSQAIYKINQFYSDTRWKQMLYDQLDENLPLYYAADDKNGNGGHAFVLDGYDSDGKFHVNFGWNGSGNGFYEFPQFNASGYYFTDGHEAVFHIKKATGSEVTPDGEISFDKYYSTHTGLSSTSTGFAAGVSFKVKASGIYINTGEVAFSGKLAVGRANSDKVLQEIISSEYNISNLATFSYYNGGTFTCTATALNEGDCAMLFFMETGKDKWTVMPSNTTDNFVTALPLPIKEVEEDLPESTIITLDKTTSTLSIKTLSEATLSVKGPNGEDVSYSGQSGQFSLDTSKLSSGKYAITLKYKSQTKQLDVVL